MSELPGEREEHPISRPSLRRILITAGIARPRTRRAPKHRSRVEIQERLDGSPAVYYQDELVASKPAPLEAPALRARNGRAHAQPPTLDGGGRALPSGYP